MLCRTKQNKKQSISKKCAKSQNPKIPNCDFEMLTSQNNIDNTIKNLKERINQKKEQNKHKIKIKHKNSNIHGQQLHRDHPQNDSVPVHHQSMYIQCLDWN